MTRSVIQVCTFPVTLAKERALDDPRLPFALGFRGSLLRAFPREGAGGSDAATGGSASLCRVLSV